MFRQESVSGGVTAPPIPFPETGVAAKWSTMEQRMGHPLLQSLRGVRKGTLRLYLPDGSEVFYVGADPGYHATMRFQGWKTLDRIAMGGELALGEEYAAGCWTTTDIKKLLRFAAENNAFAESVPAEPLARLARFARRKIFAEGARSRRLHPRYEIGNEFYKSWLDGSMSASAALFHGDGAVPLEDAQRAKHRRILGRLDLQKGEHVLDLGCGWGAFMEEAARCGLRATGVTLAAEQAAYAKHRLAGFGDMTEVRLDDYRRAPGQYDAVVSIGILETLHENAWADFVGCVSRNLKPGGRAILQTSVMRDDLFDAYRSGTDFAREHVSPRCLIPSRKSIEDVARRAGLKISDTYHFGRDQAMTFDKWIDRFDSSALKLRDAGYCDPFLRKWRFHMASRAAQFETRQLDMIQIELTKPRT